MKQGKRITFRYKNQCRVKGKIIGKEGRLITVMLEEPIADKGEVFLIGHKKVFSFKDINDIYITDAT